MSEVQEETAACLYDILADEYDVLSHIHEEQQITRKAVGKRDWDMLQNSIGKTDELSQKFAQLESDRVLCFGAFGCPGGNDIYQIIPKLPRRFKQSIPDLFHQIRRKLIVSKIENDSMNDYIRITRGFLQGVFDAVSAQRRTTIYSRDGVVRNKPESMVVNTVL